MNDMWCLYSKLRIAQTGIVIVVITLIATTHQYTTQEQVDIDISSHFKGVTILFHPL